MAGTIFSTNLRRIREERGLSQAELARRAELTSVAVNLLESGQRRPLLDTVLVLAQALECKPEELYAAPVAAQA